MILDSEIKKALNSAIDLVVLSAERERMARYTADLLVPAVRRLIIEELRKAKGKA